MHVAQIVSEELLPLMRPKVLRAVCLPGIDCQEVFSTCDRLALPRANIVGIERDKAISDVIENRATGIGLFRGSVEDFARSSGSHHFHLLSLDYTGVLKVGDLAALRHLVITNAATKFVIHHATSARQDSVSHDILRVSTIGSGENIDAAPAGASGITARMFAAQFETRAQSEKRFAEMRSEPGGLKRLRSDAVTSALVDAIQLPNSPADDLSALQALRVDDLSGLLDAGAQVFNQRYGLDPRTRPDKDGAEYGTLARTVWHHYACSLIEQYYRGLGVPEAGVGLMVAMHRAAHTPRYMRFVTRMSRYSYISESACPMLGDVFVVTQNREAVKAAGYVMDKVTKYGRRGGYALFARDIDEAVRTFIGAFDQSLITDKNIQGCERLFFGSAAKPVLTKELAIASFASGASVDDVKSRYRRWQGKPLAQWKAHSTMGTYEDTNGAAAAAEDGELSKAEAVDLLSAGVPIAEILEAFPGMFSAGQLRALKAHITMGTYKRERGAQDN